MMFYLECDMNLLIYGVGSKKDILQNFLQSHVFECFPSILIRGYHSGLMPKTILTDLAEYIYTSRGNKSIKMRKKEKWTSTSEIIEFIKRCLQHLDDLQDDDDELKPIVIMIHSMDVGVLKG